MTHAAACAIGVAPLGLAWAAGLALLCLRPQWRMRLDTLAPAGRMAITNYIAQTVICSALFYGPGLGWAGRVGPTLFIPIALGDDPEQALAVVAEVHGHGLDYLKIYAGLWRPAFPVIAGEAARGARSTSGGGRWSIEMRVAAGRHRPGAVMIVRGVVPASGLVLLLAACAAAPPQRADHGTAAHYPATRVDRVFDDYHGTRVADPFRWLEDLTSPEVRAWAAAQDSVTTAVLAGDPLRERLLARMHEFAAPWDQIPDAAEAATGGSLQVALAPSAGRAHRVLSVRQPGAGSRLLVDPRDYGSDVEIVRFVVSPDERHVAYALSSAGSEWWQVRVRRVDDGSALPDVLHDVLWEMPVWSRDGSGFFYVRYRRASPGQRTAFHSPAVLYHRLGTYAADHVIYQAPEGTTTLAVGVQLTPDGRHLLVREGEGAHAEAVGWLNSRRWLLDLKDPYAPDLTAALVPLTPDRTSAYELVGQRDSLLYFITDRAAPRRRLVAVNVRDPAADRWREIIPQQEHVLDRIMEVNGRWVAVYVRDMEHRLHVFDVDGGALRELQLPPLSGVHEIRRRSQSEIEILTSSFLRPPALIMHDLETGATRAVQQPGTPFDTAAFEARRVWYESRDGTRVPMFLLHRRNLLRDGSHPTLLYGYGASSDLTWTVPVHDEAYLAWLHMGGIIALPALRGGGEYGRDWYEAAILERKQTTFDDFIAAAEWLIGQGYTSPAKLAIRGTSNGGLLVATVTAQRPDLFAAAVAQVPVVDMLRFDFGRHRAQFGHVHDPAQFPFLHAYAPLQRIRSGTCYPATLIMTAANDDRVPAWHAFKLAATLQNAQGCARPVLLRVHGGGGHLGNRGPDAWLEDNAEIMAFLARQLGGRDAGEWF